MELFMDIFIALLFLALAQGLKAKKKNAGKQQGEERRQPYDGPAVSAPGPNIRPVRTAAKTAEKQTAPRPAVKRTVSAAMQQTAQRAAEQRNTTIVERARKNTAKLADDVTLKEIEEAHGHSEKQPQEVHEHSRNCQELKKDPAAVPAEKVENTLGTIEDLMVKGYDGNMKFDRDFIGEASDMLGRISVPNLDLPDTDLPV